jgi:cell division protein FtsB
MALLGYFAWNALHGARGYPYRDQLSNQLAALTKDVEALTQQRQVIESKVKLMRPESIDPDLLDELARRELFLGKPNDIIVRTGQ